MLSVSFSPQLSFEKKKIIAQSAKEFTCLGVDRPQLDNDKFLLQMYKLILPLEQHSNKYLVEYTKNKMSSNGMPDDYGNYIMWLIANETRISSFIADMTNHTTFWFRDNYQFDFLEDLIEREVFYRSGTMLSLNILSVACSTGEEVYSISIMMQKLKSKHPEIVYKIKGIDVDAASVNHAREGVYKKDSVIKNIQDPYSYFDKVNEGHLRIKDIYKNDVIIECSNILNYKEYNKYHIVFCRNIMIYCDHIQTKNIIDSIYRFTNPFGYLLLGSSEAIDYSHEGFLKTGKSIYKTKGRPSHFDLDRNEVFSPKLFSYKIPRDRLAKLRKLSDGETKMKIHEYKPGERSDQLKPGSIVLVEHASHLNEVSKYIGGYYAEKIVIDDMEKNIFSYVSGSSQSKKISGLRNTLSLSSFISPKREADVSLAIEEKELRPLDLIVIGSSTGGPEALKVLLKNLPRETPPIVILQHILPNFSEEFSSKLAKQINRPLCNGMKQYLRNNYVYMTNKTYDMRMGHDRKGIYVEKIQNKSNYHPNIDFFMNSILNSTPRIAPNTVAYLLTGMGTDGALGMKKLREKGAITYGQSEKSCVVYGMPKAAKKMGGIMFELGLEDLNLSLLNVINKRINIPKFKL